MGENELKIALKNQGEQQIRTGWESAEQRVSERRCAIEEAVAGLQEQTDRQLQIQTAAQRSELLHEAQTRTREGRLHAEADLGCRLYALAQELLPELAATERRQRWQALCDEIPPAEWQQVLVCTPDRAQAQQVFPACEISLEDNLGGGLMVTTAEGLITVDNSLRCRLQRSWPALLSNLLAELRILVESDEATDTDTSS